MQIWCEFIDIRNLGLVVSFLEIEVFSSWVICFIRFIVKVLLVLRIRFLVDVFKGTSHELGICGECNYVIVPPRGASDHSTTTHSCLVHD